MVVGIFAFREFSDHLSYRFTPYIGILDSEMTKLTKRNIIESSRGENIQ